MLLLLSAVIQSKRPKFSFFSSSGNVGNFQASTKKSASFDSSSHSSEDVLFAANTVNYITEKMKKDDRSKIVSHFPRCFVFQSFWVLFALSIYVISSYSCPQRPENILFNLAIFPKPSGAALALSVKRNCTGRMHKIQDRNLNVYILGKKYSCKYSLRYEKVICNSIVQSNK